MKADRRSNTLIKKNKTVRQAVRQGLLWGSAALVGGLVCGQALAQDQDKDQDALVDEAQELE